MPTPQASSESERSALPVEILARVTEQRKGSILLIGLNRPEAENRLDPPTYDALARAYYRLNSDPSLRAGLLFGHGTSFCRGIDVEAFQKTIAGQSDPSFQSGRIDPFRKGSRQLTKPLIAVVHGNTWNIGHELMLAADVRVAARTTRFLQAENTQGRMPGSGATIRFVRDAGWGNAMAKMLTGESWTADDALRMGSIQKIGDDQAAAMSLGLELAAKISDCAPRSIEASLRSAHLAIDPAENPAIAALNSQRTALYRTADFREGLEAGRQHRMPKFKGR
jgi:enoyl-CoA hydratase